ncbi:MAG: sulfatase, partial [Verrucomicrobia bacterium]|nr:sulfatase [Verrucomicrobiota bacterium]
MKRLFITLLLAIRAVSSASAAPSFVVIYGEGAGWSSSSVQMDDRNPASRSTSLKTPNLERLAAAGMRFANGYAASPRCTPSRAALFTGRSPAALHMTFVGDGRRDEAVLARVIAPHAVLELPESTTTIGELLQRAGYATAHFGKWHVGRESPAKHGFSENDGANNNGGPENVASPNP